MGIKTIKKLEKVLIAFLNMDGWDLEWTGNAYEHYDAKGFTPKGNPCVIEMKFRNKYYPEKMLEKYKYDALMKMDKKRELLILVKCLRASRTKRYVLS
jgi:hypothetical protein